MQTLGKRRKEEEEEEVKKIETKQSRRKSREAEKQGRGLLCFLIKDCS